MPEEKKSYPMSVILASKSVSELGTTLSLTPEQITRAKSSALQLSSNPTLYKCDKFSLIKYCFETARYNFTRDDCIYPVPYGNYIQAQLGYRGFRELCLRSGYYKEISCSEVYSCDTLVRDRETGKIKVVFNDDPNALIDATIIGFYAYAIDNEGAICNSLYWSKEQCEKHGHAYSKTYNSVWGSPEGFIKMAKKTVIKQLCGELKTTPELVEAIKQDQIVYGAEGESDTYADNPQNDIIDETEPDIE